MTRVCFFLLQIAELTVHSTPCQERSQVTEHAHRMPEQAHRRFGGQTRHGMQNVAFLTLLWSRIPESRRAGVRYSRKLTGQEKPGDTPLGLTWLSVRDCVWSLLVAAAPETLANSNRRLSEL